MRSLGVVPILFSLIGSNAIAQVAAEFDGNVILGRPTDTTMSVSVMGFSEQAVYVGYGSGSGNYDLRTPAARIPANEPRVFELVGLEPDAAYSYRLQFRQGGEGDFLDSEPGDFHTARAKGSEFTFAVEADSHMGAMTRHQKWCDTCGRELADDLTMANTMANMVAYNPDFIVDLGDTFMTSQNFGNGLFEIQNRQRGAPIRQEDMVGDYLLLRRHLSQSAFTVPLFLVLGNHDAERWAVSSSIGSRKRSNRATLRSSSCFSIVSSGGTTVLSAVRAAGTSTPSISSTSRRSRIATSRTVATWPTPIQFQRTRVRVSGASGSTNRGRVMIPDRAARTSAKRNLSTTLRHRCS